MKKAFSLIEIVFVIVILSVLISFVKISYKNNKLYEAANQILFHLRYTQHLALIDDKISLSDNVWFKARWQLLFRKNTGSDNRWSYIVFSDWKGKHTGNPDKGEVAINPLDPNRFLTGGSSGNAIIHYEDHQSTKSLNIGHEFGIMDVKFSGGCRSNMTRIGFDYLGRPFNSLNKEYPYELPSSGWHKLIEKKCYIKLCSVEDCDLADKSEYILIAIEAISGFAYIEESNSK